MSHRSSLFCIVVAAVFANACKCRSSSPAGPASGASPASPESGPVSAGPATVHHETPASACTVPFAAGPTTLTNATLPGMPADILAADVDADGYLDLVIATGNDHGTGQVQVLFGPFNGGTPQYTWTSNAANYYRRLAVGDIDGDGDLDIAVALVTAAPSRGRLHPKTTYPCDGGAPQFGGGAGSVNATLVSASTGGSVAIFQSEGSNPRDLGSTPTQTFAFTPAACSDGDAVVAGSVDFGDFNGDGHLDLAVGAGTEDRSCTAPVQVLQNAGNGSLLGTSGGAGWLSAVTLFGFSVRFLDWNGDGLVDLLVTGYQGAQWGFLFQGTQSGSTVALAKTPTPLSVPGGLACAPGFASDAIAQDGDGGAVVAAAINALNSYWFGLPTTAALAQTSSVQELISASPIATGIRLADLDNDGRLDMTFATLSFTPGYDAGTCGSDPALAGSLYCVGDVLGSRAPPALALGSSFYDQGVATGDLHEKTGTRTYAVPTCAGAGTRFVIPVPDPAFAGFTASSQVTVGQAPPLARSGYAIAPNDRLLYVAGGVPCGTPASVTYNYSPGTDIALCSTDSSCLTTSVSIFFNGITTASIR